MSNKNPDKGKGFCWERIFEGIIPCFVKDIREYRRIKINPILENEKNTDEVKKEQLEEELRIVRFCYNFWNSFSSKFVFEFLSGLIGLLVGFTKFADEDASIFAVGFFFIIILLCKGVLVCGTNIYYEEMKVVKAELEKINNPAQSNPEKISIRIYNRNLVRRSIFCR